MLTDNGLCGIIEDVDSGSSDEKTNFSSNSRMTGM